MVEIPQRPKQLQAHQHSEHRVHTPGKNVAAEAGSGLGPTPAEHAVRFSNGPLYFTASPRISAASRKGRARGPLLLLDWKQAFDKVSMEALQVRRCGVPESILNLLTNVYTSQSFQVKATGQTSEILEAKSGIRQVCPHSPYLFLIVHSRKTAASLGFSVSKHLSTTLPRSGSSRKDVTDRLRKA